MWIVENTLRARLTLRGLGVSIAPGEQFDLDILGRRRAEESNQVLVAFEEGYLANVYRTPTHDPNATAGPALGPDAPLPLEEASVGSASDDSLGPQGGARLEAFRREVLAEVRAALPHLGEPLTDPTRRDMQELVGELKRIREQFLGFSEQVQLDAGLDPDEVAARLAVLDEEERKLLDGYGVAGPEGM